MVKYLKKINQFFLSLCEWGSCLQDTDYVSVCYIGKVWGSTVGVKKQYIDTLIV